VSVGTPHVTFVCLSGVRVREVEVTSLGMLPPGLQARAAAIMALPPLGVLTLAGMTPAPWTLSLHETQRVNDAAVEAIVRERPTLVAISALTASILEAYELARRLREQGVATLLGGLHVTACPDEAERHADAIVIGDGESVWHEVLCDVERNALQSRYRGAAPFDLSQAPLPRFDLARGERPRFTVQSSRGCPFACDFCAASRLLGPFRRKPAEQLRAELSAIREIDRRPFIELADDNTFAAGGPHLDLLTALAESGARWFTEADWRLGENPAVLRRLAASGCVQVLVGLESLVHEHQGMGAKRTSIARMMDAVASIQDAGVAVIGCFIVGSDGEDRESLDRLARFLEQDPCADAQVTLQTPFPGTELRARLEREGRLLPDRDWSHCTLFDITYRPDRMAPDELQRAFIDLLRHGFSAAQSTRRNEIRRAVWAKARSMA